nr:MAG TPA: hypothetical protein [Caudoviricetes sp.]
MTYIFILFMSISPLLFFLKITQGYTVTRFFQKH